MEIVSDSRAEDGEHLVKFPYKCRVVGQNLTSSAEEKHSELEHVPPGENGEWPFPDGITEAPWIL